MDLLVYMTLLCAAAWLASFQFHFTFFSPLETLYRFTTLKLSLPHFQHLLVGFGAAKAVVLSKMSIARRVKLICENMIGFSTSLQFQASRFGSLFIWVGGALCWYKRELNTLLEQLLRWQGGPDM